MSCAQDYRSVFSSLSTQTPTILKICRICANVGVQDPVSSWALWVPRREGLVMELTEDRTVMAEAGRPSEIVSDGNPDFVLSLARGLKVIEAFEGHTEGQTVADVSRTTNLSRAAVRRSLITLELLGYVESSGRNYRLK